MAKCYGLFWQQWFCSEKPPASQRQCQCIEVILCIELKQSCCENLESVLSVFAKLSDLEIIFCHFKVCSCRLVTFVSWLESDNISPVFRYIFEICPLLMVCTWKIACSKHLQRSGTNIDVSYGPNRALLGVRWCNLMVHFVLHNESTLSSY